MYGNTFNLFYKDWITDKLDKRESSAEETQILNHILVFQPHCNVDLFPCAVAACLAHDQEVLVFSRDPDNWARDFELDSLIFQTHLKLLLFIISISVPLYTLFPFYIPFFFATIED